MPKNDQLLESQLEMTPIKKLPNMNEFSPGVLETQGIKQFLLSLAPNNGKKESMIARICQFPKILRTPVRQRNNRANNVLIGMSQCGLIEKQGRLITGTLTPLAQEILASEDDLSANRRFARHLLENCFGLELIDAVEMIRARGEPLKVQAIREELRSRGFEVTENEGNASKIREWLEGSGVINDQWIINETKLHEVTGATTPALATWHSLTRGQRAFLEQLKLQDETSGKNWLPVRQLKKLVEIAYARSVFPEGKLRENIIDPLEQQGWLKARGKGSGRGGDSGDVRAEPMLRDIKIKLPINVTTGIPADLRNKLAIPLPNIFTDLKSTNTHKKGLALELLAIRLSRDIGLTPVCFRERSAKTQGAEVDLVANGINLHYSRWLLQCKNTKTVNVHDIAKEVGMAVVLKAHVIALITTGKFSRVVQTYADGLAESSALQAVLIDGDVLKKYQSSGGTAVIDWLHQTAYRVLTLKEKQVLDLEDQ